MFLEYEENRHYLVFLVKHMTLVQESSEMVNLRKCTPLIDQSSSKDTEQVRGEITLDVSFTNDRETSWEVRTIRAKHLNFVQSH